MARRKDTWSRALAAEERYRKEHAVDNSWMLLSSSLPQLNPNARFEISRKFKRRRA